MNTVEGWMLRVVLEYLFPGAGEALSVFYFTVVGGGDTFQECLDSFTDWATNEWGPAWAASASADADLVSVSVDHVNFDHEVLDNIGTASIAVPGGLASEVAPAGACGFFFGDTARPKTRGRKFIPAFGTSRIDDGQWNGTALTHLLNMLLVYLAPVETTTNDRYDPGVISNPLPENGDPSFQLFLGDGVASAVPAYQRRRRPGTGS